MKPLLVALVVLFAAPVSAQPSRIGELATFTFARGSASFVVRADAPVARDVGEIAAWTQQNPDGIIVLDGHADKRGSARANVRLSLDRAKAVRDKLLRAGAQPSQIVIAAHGARYAHRNLHDRKVVVWATRSGMLAVTKRSHAQGRVVLTHIDLDRVASR